MTRQVTRVSKSTVVSALLIAAALAGCKKPAVPNSAAEEDKLLFEFGQALIVADKDAALAKWDIELRQKLEFWEKQLKPLNNPTKQADLLAQNAPRLGEAAALKTEADEVWKSVQDAPWKQELADGKCISGAPSRDDIGRGVVPRPVKEMGQDLGTFVYELHSAIGWAPAFRVNCPTTGNFWVQMVRRKKGPTDADEPPLKFARIAP